MSKLKTLFLYREKFDSNRPLDKPSIEDNKFVLSEEKSNEIVWYLENGYVLWEFVSPIKDPYDSNDIVPNIIYSDGVYAWDAVIINWIKKYRIRLPSEFISYFDQIKDKSIDKTLYKLDDLAELYKQSELVYC